MANLSGVLAGVPGLAGYLAKQQFDQQQEMGQVQQMGALAQLQASMQNQQAQAQTRQRQDAARQALADLGPNATEDQRVQALLPHIGDPDKIAGILQNASLKKAQQAQTREIAAQNLSQRLATEARHAYEFAKTLPLKERQVALQEINTRLNAAYKQGMLRLSAGEAQWSRGEDVSPIMDYLNTMRGIVDSPSAPQGASAAPVAPTPQPAPSAAPGPSATPGGAVPGPMMDSGGLGKLTPDQLAMGIQEAIVSGGQYPNDPAHKAAYDRFVAEAQRRGMSVNAPFPQAAPAPETTNNIDARDLRLAAPSGAPAAPSPEPSPSVAPTEAPKIVMPPEIARLPKKAQDAWMADQIKKQGDSKNRVLDERAIEDERKRGLRLTLQNERANLVLKTVDETLDKIGFMNTGLIGGVTKYIPSSPAFNLDKAVDTLKANIGFQELQAMREASPTGGALGQVAVQELNMLQSVLGSLDVGQSSDQLRKNLGAVKTHYENWKRIMQQAEASRIPKVGAVVDGFRFKGGDPSKSTSWEQLK